MREITLSFFLTTLSRGLRSALVLSIFFATVGFARSANAARYPVPPLFQGTRTAIAQVGFSPTVVATGRESEAIKRMHILERPYRPLHFYGNSVRRRYYRQRLR